MDRVAGGRDKSGRRVLSVSDANEVYFVETQRFSMHQVVGGVRRAVDAIRRVYDWLQGRRMVWDNRHTSHGHGLHVLVVVASGKWEKP